MNFDVKMLADVPPWEWPPKTGEMLKETLREPKTSLADKMAAVEMAGDLVVMDDGMAELVLSLVRNASEPELLRARAAIALGPVLEQTDLEGFDDVLSEPPIHKMMFDRLQDTLHEIWIDTTGPKEVRRRVLEASVRAPRDWHREAVREAAASPDAEWQLTAVFCMRWIRGFDKQIVAFMESKNPEIHYEAVLAAGASEIDQAWPHVLNLLKFEREDQRLLIAAIEAAGSIRPREAEDMLRDFANSDDEAIAEAAEDALMFLEPDSDDEEDDEEE